MTSDARVVILDTETTGLEIKDNNRIIEIACLEVIDGEITDQKFHTLLNPGRDIESAAAEIHGRTLDELLDQPKFEEIADELVAFIRDSQLVMHNASFDVAFLNYELSLMNAPHMVEDLCEVVDSLALARKKHPRKLNDLDALAKRYKISDTKRQVHDAMNDVELLAEVYLHLTFEEKSLLFEMDEQIKPIDSIDYRIDRMSRKNVVVVRATEEEISRHNEYMSALEKSEHLADQPT